MKGVDKPLLIAITGDIGSGKSVVSRILSVLGYDVYDCDSCARRLMDSSSRMINEIRSHFGDSVINDGKIDRRRLGVIVFSDNNALEKLNSIVHGQVRQDIAMWHESHSKCSGVVFVETAILYQSRLDMMVDMVWEVVAPRRVRLERIMMRNGFSVAEAESRIRSQESYVPSRHHESVSQIINDGNLAVLPQIEILLAGI